MIEIKKELCIGCGACVKDCPGKALAIEDGKAVYKKECIHCGHCVAICPVNAVSIPEYDMAVSYTHLDVYKRQMWKNGFINLKSKNSGH